MDLIAHRGRVGSDPENAVEGLGNASRHAAGVEVDVRLTADGVAVLMHDPTVDRTTDGTGAIADLSADEVTVLELAPQVRIPRLADYLSGVTASEVDVVLLDIKDEQMACLEQVAAALVASPAAPSCVALVRTGAAMATLRSLAPAARLGCLGVTEDNVHELIDAAQAVDAELLLVHHGDRAYLDNRGTVATVTASGLRIGASTLYRRDVLDAAEQDGCELALTDFPGAR
jgi:glycerophosphoryl diester phosphodiesterase